MARERGNAISVRFSESEIGAMDSLAKYYKKLGKIPDSTRSSLLRLALMFLQTYTVDEIDKKRYGTRGRGRS